MKVSTDACIQGAWTARQLHNLPPVHRILDIGTGTGLLSLMLAQEQEQVTIDAIELNEDAALQAAENFLASPWNSRLKALHTALSDFGSRPGQYDLIICNPPFFHNQLGSERRARHDARHSTALNKDSLARAIAMLLHEKGYGSIMYPLSEWDDWLATAARHGLYPAAVLAIHPGNHTAANRMIGIFSRAAQPYETSDMVIYEDDRSYTAMFRELLKSYYLYL